MFLASNCTRAVYFTYTAHVQLLAKNMAATRAITYAIKQTPYTFVAKIILCMYLLYDHIVGNSGSTMLNNIVDNIEQCWQQNIL